MKLTEVASVVTGFDDLDGNLQRLSQLGGGDGFAQALGVAPTDGLGRLQVDVQRNTYGSNEMPEPKAKTWLEVSSGCTMHTSTFTVVLSTHVLVRAPLHFTPPLTAKHATPPARLSAYTQTHPYLTPPEHLRCPRPPSDKPPPLPYPPSLSLILALSCSSMSSRMTLRLVLQMLCTLCMPRRSQC